VVTTHTVVTELSTTVPTMAPTWAQPNVSTYYNCDLCGNCHFDGFCSTGGYCDPDEICSLLVLLHNL
jgi:hypothetical protein